MDVIILKRNLRHRIQYFLAKCYSDEGGSVDINKYIHYNIGYVSNSETGSHNSS